MKKKLKFIIFIIVLLVIVNIILFLIPEKNYSITYKIDGYDIYESYNYDKKIYYFSIMSDDKLFEFVTSDKYVGKKKITAIQAYQSETYTCLEVESNKLNFYPSCFKGDQSIAYSLIEEKDFKEFFTIIEPKYQKDNYRNIEINTFLEKSFFIWNNKGIYILNSKDKLYKEFLKNETYYDNLSYSNGRYIIVPDYDQKYSFDKYYIIDMKKCKISEWNLEENISFNSYYLGVHNNKIYIIDKKNSKEYSLDPQKKKMVLESGSDKYGKVWKNKWETISMVKLVNNEYSFVDETSYIFKLNNSKLYLSYFKGENNILISDKNVDKIIHSENDEVYYIVDDKLYYYSFKYGEVLLMSYDEWNFNKNNPIYIY